MECITERARLMKSPFSVNPLTLSYHTPICLLWLTLWLIKKKIHFVKFTSSMLFWIRCSPWKHSSDSHLLDPVGPSEKIQLCHLFKSIRKIRVSGSSLHLPYQQMHYPGIKNYWKYRVCGFSEFGVSIVFHLFYLNNVFTSVVSSLLLGLMAVNEGWTTPRDK